MKDIFIVQRIFPTYRKPVFDAIYSKVPFTLLHSENQSGIKQTTSAYSLPVKKVQYWKGDTHLFLKVFKHIKLQKPKVVVHELAAGIISLPFVFLFRKIFGYKVILWGHMYDHKKGFSPQTSIADRYRKLLQRSADAIITYSFGEKDVLTRNNINATKIFVALNTINTTKCLAIRNQFDLIGKQQVKEKVGFTHDINLIHIGRLYKDKLPHYLIEILSIIKKRENVSIAVHFVGSGSMQSELMEIADKHGLKELVFFYGEIYDEYTTGQLLYASDMMVMPGCVGLSVNHAFCFDCPVITFESKGNNPAHGPEIEYIINKKTGFIAEHNNVTDMASIIENYLNNVNLQTQMKIEIRNMIENICSIDKLVAGFTEAIHFAEANNSVRHN